MRIYIDLHLCFGALAAGHTNPHINQGLQSCHSLISSSFFIYIFYYPFNLFSYSAIIQSVSKGILVGAPVEDNIRVSSLLSQLFAPYLSYWRFTNSGTEATRDSIQVGGEGTERVKLTEVTDRKGNHRIRLHHKDGVWMAWTT